MAEEEYRPRENDHLVEPFYEGVGVEPEPEPAPGWFARLGAWLRACFRGKR